MQGDLIITYKIVMDNREREELIKEIKSLKMKRRTWTDLWHLKHLLGILKELE